MEVLEKRLGLSFLVGLGPIRVKYLLSKLNDLDELYQGSLLHLKKITGFSESVLSQLNRKEAIEQAKRELEYCSREGIKPLFFDDDVYPRRLKQCPDAPIVLYHKGATDLNHRRMVSVVGTRNFTPYGKSLVHELIQGLSQAGVCVVSGLALGIDALAHEEALNLKIPTIGVLGHGLSTIFPRKNLRLAEEILSQNGSLVSEYSFNSLPIKEHFALRNRIVAGLSDALIVVESKTRGGSLITASFANDYHREVFAFPGSIRQECSAGCNDLIKEHKAHLITSSDDVLSMMNWQTQGPSQQLSMAFLPTETESLILSTLKRYESVFIDELVQLTQLSASTLQVNLLGLQLKNVVLALSGNRYAIR